MTHDSTAQTENTAQTDSTPETETPPPPPNEMSADALRNVVGGSCYVLTQTMINTAVTQQYQQDIAAADNATLSLLGTTSPLGGGGILGPAPPMSTGPLTYDPPGGFAPT